MYEAFFNLSTDPFRLLPDPGICFPHRSCAKAWAYLRYALKRGEGIVVVTGPPGSGKTTLAERLLNELNPAKTVSVRLIANDLNATDLLRKLAYSFGLPAEGMDRAMLAHRIERYLVELEQNQRRALVLIDEAQTLSHHSLEAMRLLTDLQSRSNPVLQLFLLGQEELEGVMCAPGMAQFQQRVIASSRLHTMDLSETKAYLEYRLEFADWAGDPAIDGPAVMAVFRYSQGLPRHINKICSRLFLHACTEEKHTVGEQDVLAVVQDLRDELLAPLAGEREVSATTEGTAFGSVYELALVPSTRPETTAGGSPRVGKDPAPAIAGQRAAAGGPRQARSGPSKGDRYSDSAGRHVYGTGYPRPYPLRRRTYRLLSSSRILIRRSWGSVVSWAQRVMQALVRGGREAGVALNRGRQALSGWAAGPALVEWGQKSWGRWSTLPRAAVAGFGALLLAVVTVVVWDRGGDPESTLAGGEGVDPGDRGGVLALSEGRRYLDVTALAIQSGGVPDQGLLDTSHYHDLAAAQPLPVSKEGLLLNAGPPSTTLGAGLGNLADGSGIDGDLGMLVLGKVSDDVADLLAGSVGQLESTTEAWALANNAQANAPGTELYSVRLAGSNGGTPRNARRASSGPVTEAEKTAPVQVATPRPGSREASDTPLQARASQPPKTGQLGLIASDDGSASGNDIRALPTQDAREEPTVSAADNGLAEDQEQLFQALATLPATAAGPGVSEASVDSMAVESDEVDPALVAEDPVGQLLALADAAMEKDHLMQPPEGSAYSIYQRVLTLDAQNEVARAGLDRIVRRYADLARWALKKQQFDRAKRYVGRALEVEPDNAKVRVLRNQVEDAVAQARAAELEEAELARWALEMRNPEPVVELEEVPEDSSFNNLMLVVDGFYNEGGN